MGNAPTVETPAQSHIAGEIHSTQAPPVTFTGILSRLGPGLIIAASIVGSGELIGTTKTGAQAGIWLLWLILIGCLIKVFVQVEFGRFAVCEGQTSMEGMNAVPGPRLRVNWLVWYWLAMFCVGLGQLGGIVGGVGESMAIAVPLTGDNQRAFSLRHETAQFEREVRARAVAAGFAASGENDTDEQRARRNEIEQAVATELGHRPPSAVVEAESTRDDIYWSWIITAITAVLLVNGRYSLIQNVSTVLVAIFTAVTVFNVIALQTHDAWALSWGDFKNGLSFQLPPAKEGAAWAPLMTALATFGIIGVGASELVAYPYWCIERGYARFTGRRDGTHAWAERANGWMRVMRWDAWLSMLIYTFATIAFYLQGAAVLNREGLDVSGGQIVYTLAQMYVPIFGRWAGPVFLLGAFAVLYSTFFVATAGNARIAADALRVFGLGSATEASRVRMVKILCGVFPFVSVIIYTIIKEPVRLVLISGLMQSIMLPMLAAAALYFRYFRTDSRIAPGKLWDAMLWLSSLGLLIAGAFGAWDGIAKAIRAIWQ